MTDRETTARKATDPEPDAGEPDAGEPTARDRAASAVRRGLDGTQARDVDAALAVARLPPLTRTAWLEIDLDAIVANLRAIQRAVGAGTHVDGVVKADAYGHGLVPVARALDAAGVHGLAVATLDEAFALRDAGVRARVLVLYPVPPSLAPAAAERAMTLTTGSVAHATDLLAALAARARRERPLRLQVEIETGLGRGGIDPDEVEPLVRLLADSPDVEVAGWWSHLQEAEDRPRTDAQVERFDAARRAIEGVLGPRRRPIRETAGLTEDRRDDAADGLGRAHLAATAALLTRATPAYDGVRPGLSLYGVVPDELLEGGVVDTALSAALVPAMALRARPVRVADLPTGWGISYGPTWTTTRASRIATLPLGYGDGWPRSLSNRAEALVRGRRVPIVGNVAMDAVMVDVTIVPGEPVSTADVFTLLGADGTERITAHALARSRNTNAWEVLTAMSPRVARVYYRAAVPVAHRTLNSLSESGDSWLESSSGTGTSATWRSTRS